MSSTDDYNPSTALTAYYRDRNERRPARLWATEKLLHDLKAAGIVDFFEGPGSNPTTMAGYASTKIWLRVSSGITGAPGTIRAYDSVGDPTLLASWPLLTATSFAAFLGPPTTAQVHAAGAFVKSLDNSDDVPEGSANKYRRAVYADDFGAIGDYDQSDGSGTDDSDAINAALAASNYVYLDPNKAYLINKTVIVPPYKTLDGQGNGMTGMVGDDDAWELATGAILVPRDLPREHTVTAMITSCDHWGGVVDNPDSGESYTNDCGTRLDQYKLTDFTNRDASGATKATPREFSVGVKLKRGSRLKGARVRTTRANGNYVSVNTDTDFGHQTDLGVLAENAFFGQLVECSVSWAFRIAALGELLYDAGDGWIPQGDRFLVDRSYLEGHVSRLVRSYDACRVTGATSNSITIPWFASHLFDAAGELDVDGTGYTYTGLTFTPGSPDTLTFTGVSPDPDGNGVADGSALSRAEDTVNFGFGGTASRQTFYRSITHPSLKPSTHDDFTDVFPTSGKLIEASGATVRGLHFDGYFHSREDVAAFLHDARDVFFSGYHEAKFTTVGGSAARFIALSSEAKAAGVGNVPYPIKEAAYVKFVGGWSQTESQTDRNPTYRTASSVGRFGDTAGLFEPRRPEADDYELSNAGSGTIRVIRAPWARGERHPLQFLNRFGFLRASMDADGRWGFGSGYDTETDLSYQGNFFVGSGGRIASLNPGSTGTAGFRAENFAGNAELVVTADGRGLLRTNNTDRLNFGPNYMTFLGRGMWQIVGHSAVAAAVSSTTAEEVLATISIPAGAMGANGRLRITVQWTLTSGADDKTIRVRLGGLAGTAFNTVLLTSNAYSRFQVEICNRNSAASQIGVINTNSGFGASSLSPATGTVNTANAQDLVITGQKETAGDTLQLESYSVELLHGL